jgi:hypothetical protein
MNMSLLALLPVIGNVLDRVLPNAQAASDAKIKMLELVQKGELTELSEKASIIREEAKSEHVLAATWRPVLMLTFGALIVARWLGFSAPGITEAEILKLWDIVELGLGGYVIGRSAEKIVPTLAGALKGK